MASTTRRFCSRRGPCRRLVADVVTVRLFAAAREAAGSATVQIPAGPVGDGLASLGLGERFAQVLAMCTLVSDGRQLAPGDVVSDDSLVDVLPPFAGG